MINPRGAVCRIEFEPVCKTVYLRRNDALLALVEWDWVDSPRDRFVFLSYEDAVNKAAELKASGEGHVHAVVVGELDSTAAIMEIHARQSDEWAAATERTREGYRAKPRGESPIVTRIDAQARWEAEHDGQG